MRFLVLLFCWLSLGAWTELGFNFRDSSGYVTDDPSETYVLGETTSTTRGGATFQWDSCPDCRRNRDSGVDRRLAGVNQRSNVGTQITWTLTIDPGTYTVCLALGDATNDQAYQRVDIYDDASLLFSVVDTDGTTAANFDDANGTNRSAAAWPGSHACKTGQVFASTSMKLKLGSTTAQSASSTIAHFYMGLEGASDNLPILQAIGED